MTRLRLSTAAHDRASLWRGITNGCIGTLLLAATVAAGWWIVAATVRGW
jgi:hypothetical protein